MEIDSILHILEMGGKSSHLDITVLSSTSNVDQWNLYSVRLDVGCALDHIGSIAVDCILEIYRSILSMYTAFPAVHVFNITAASGG